MREFREYGWEVIVSENEDIIFFGVGKRENEEGGEKNNFEHLDIIIIRV